MHLTEEQDASKEGDLSADTSMLSVSKLRILKVGPRPVKYIMILITYTIVEMISYANVVECD